MTIDWGRLLAAAGAGYLLGSIPFGLIVGRKLGRVDVRKYGSGNIGTTNVLRVLGPGPAALVLGLDVGKGALAAALGMLAAGSWGGAAGAAGAVVGHSFPVWLGFRGGKSVATAAGGLAVLSPVVLILELALFAALVALTRYVSLGSVTAAAAAPLVSMLRGEGPQNVVYAVIAGGLIIIRHKSNIQRLVAGTENKLGKRVGPG